MRMFNMGPDAATVFSRHGWAHIPNGVSAEFFSYIRSWVASALSEGQEAVGGNRANKDQFRFEFADPQADQRQALDALSALGGLCRETATLSERHVNAYNRTAVPQPPPHKDRLASQVSVGISIEVPPDSYLELYPHDDRSVNPFADASALQLHLPAECRPGVVLRGATPVRIFDRPGDVVAFAGSSMWHRRVNGAGAVNLFLKLNDFGLDPLGEDVCGNAPRSRTSLRDHSQARS